MDMYDIEEDKLGIRVTSGAVKIRYGRSVSVGGLNSVGFRLQFSYPLFFTSRKDANNLIGISIGGGSPLCPCLYIVQVGNFNRSVYNDTVLK